MKRGLIIAALLFGFLCPAAAFWQSRDSNYNVAVSGGGGGFSITLGSSKSLVSSLTTIDFGTMTYGSGCSRVVVVNAFLSNSSVATTVSGVTIGANSLTQIAGTYKTFGTSSGTVDMWETTGSIAGSADDIQVTYSNAPNPFGAAGSIGVYCLVTTTPTAAHVAVAGGFSSSATISGFVVPSGGGGIAVVSASGNITGGPSSWTNMTQDSSVAKSFTYGHFSATGTITTVATFGSSDGLEMSAASWSP